MEGRLGFGLIAVRTDDVKVRRRRVMGWVGIVVGVYALFCALAFAFQRQLMYPSPASFGARSSHAGPLDMGRFIEINHAAGQVVVLYAPARQERATIVHFHGNGEDLSGVVPLVRLFQQRGLGLMAVEYPGYGSMRDQKLGERQLYTHARAALDYAVAELGIPRERLVLQGQSLGSGVAVELASQGWGSRLILISPFVSMTELAGELMPVLPVRWLIKDRYDNRAKAAAITQPTLVVHGERDEIVPFRMGVELAELLPDAEFVRVPGAGHNDLWARHANTLLERIDEFAR